MSKLGLQWIYFQRKLPKMTPYLDSYLFTPLGLDFLEPMRKFFLAVGGAMTLVGTLLISLIYCCCLSHAREADKK
jgi:hypothetical protein